MRCDRRTVAQNEANGQQHPPPQHTLTQAKKHQNESSNERITEKKRERTKRNKTEANKQKEDKVLAFITAYMER